MTNHRGIIVAISVLLSGALPSRACAHAPPSATELTELATQAYVFGYPLVTMEYTRRVLTNVAEPKGMNSPMNQFANLRAYPSADNKQVTAPNADTLYSLAWVNLAKEPYVLELPEESDRYYLAPMLSGWTDVFADPGKRTSGTGPQQYAITGPGWSGSLPPGVKPLKSPTNMVWIMIRTYCTGTPEDYATVHAIQDKYSLMPLSAVGKTYAPPKGKVDPSIDMKTPVRDQVNALSAIEYFSLLARLMKDSPPAAADTQIVATLAKLGIVPGQDFDVKKLGAGANAALESGHKAGLAKIIGHMLHAGKDLNGWVYPVPGGQYGTDYLQRATITFFGLGCNRTEDAVYPTCEKGPDGKPFEGANHYTITFPKGQLPPVNGFWSLTMYDSEYFFVANSLDRYTLSERNKLKPNGDGSLTLYVQHENPGPSKESNWLPAAKGKFVLILRMYWPKDNSPSILNGTWQPPTVEMAKN